MNVTDLYMCIHVPVGYYMYNLILLLSAYIVINIQIYIVIKIISGIQIVWIFCFSSHPIAVVDRVVASLDFASDIQTGQHNHQ